MNFCGMMASGVLYSMDETIFRRVRGSEQVTFVYDALALRFFIHLRRDQLGLSNHRS